MSALSQNSPHVKNLRAHLIIPSNLRCISFWEHRWTCEFYCPVGMDKATFKRHVEHFLEVEFEASEFEWWRKRSGNGQDAYCHFKSFAL